MTDSRLQELKRAWEASGSVEDEAAYLRERVRVGDLSQERLELAATCGHPSAQLAHAGPAIDSVDWEEPLASLTRFGREIWLRACAIALRASFGNKDGWTVATEEWLQAFLSSQGETLLPPDLLGSLSRNRYTCPLDALSRVSSLAWPPPQGAVLLENRPREECLRLQTELEGLGANCLVTEEASGFGVELLDAGQAKLPVIRVLRDRLGINMTSGKTLVESLPIEVLYVLPLRRAEWAGDGTRVREVVCSELSWWALAESS